MKALKRSVVLLLVGAFLGACVCGCSTIKGAGKDVQSIGRGIEKASDNATN